MSYRDSYLYHAPAERAAVSVLHGATAATIMASAIGCAALGFFVILADASEAAKELMTISPAVGPLSGKTMFAVVAWLIGWGLLHILWRNKQVGLSRAYMAAFLGLLLIGLLGTFPPFYVLVAEMFH